MSSELTNLGFSAPIAKQENPLEAFGEARAVAEVQAAYVIAKKFPRNEQECYVSIMNACKRPYLAEQSMYAYPRGSTTVTGPSIRLAEAIAQNWGNLNFGIEEISQSNGVSVCRAFCVDLQTNSRSEKIFHVKHERHTKSGITRLKDPRDIYELVANQGSRRMRNCILAIIPGDVIEAAITQCTKTLETSDIPMADRIRKLTLDFDSLGVKVEHLEKRLGHKLDAMIPAEFVKLQAIGKSIRDGHAPREDFFDFGIPKDKSSAKEHLSELLQNKTTPMSQPQQTEGKSTDEKTTKN
jgi:hypothetical protein